MVEVDIKMHTTISTGVRLEFEEKQKALDFIKQFYSLVRNTTEIYLQVGEKTELVEKRNY